MGLFVALGQKSTPQRVTPVPTTDCQAIGAVVLAYIEPSPDVALREAAAQQAKRKHSLLDRIELLIADRPFRSAEVMRSAMRRVLAAAKTRGNGGNFTYQEFFKTVTHKTKSDRSARRLMADVMGLGLFELRHEPHRRDGCTKRVVVTGYAPDADTAAAAKRNQADVRSAAAARMRDMRARRKAQALGLPPPPARSKRNVWPKLARPVLADALKPQCQPDTGNLKMLRLGFKDLGVRAANIQQAPEPLDAAAIDAVDDLPLRSPDRCPVVLKSVARERADQEAKPVAQPQAPRQADSWAAGQTGGQLEDAENISALLDAQFGPAKAEPPPSDKPQDAVVATAEAHARSKEIVSAAGIGDRSLAAIVARAAARSLAAKREPPPPSPAVFLPRHAGVAPIKREPPAAKPFAQRQRHRIDPGQPPPAAWFAEHVRAHPLFGDFDISLAMRQAIGIHCWIAALEQVKGMPAGKAKKPSKVLFSAARRFQAGQWQ